MEICFLPENPKICVVETLSQFNTIQSFILTTHIQHFTVQDGVEMKLRKNKW